MDGRRLGPSIFFNHCAVLTDAQLPAQLRDNLPGGFPTSLCNLWNILETPR